MQHLFHTYKKPLLIFPLNTWDIFDKYMKNQVFMLFETSYVTESEKRSYIFANPIKSILFNKDPLKKNNMTDFFMEINDAVNCGYHVAGFFKYEFSYSYLPLQRINESKIVNDNYLALFYVFSEPIVIHHKTCDRYFIYDKPCEIRDFSLNIKADEYMDSVEKIKDYIRAGDTYQVNYTLKCRFLCDDPYSLYLNLRERQAVSYSAFIKLGSEFILSFSPELFFRRRGLNITTKPMKGTFSRGKNIQGDFTNASFLKNDIKNRAENIMIVDLLRNDLGKISEIGSVKVKNLFQVERYNSIFQMTSQIDSKLKPDICWEELFEALFPSGSVTGAPKIRTMEIIDDLEREARGVYTGAIGFFAPKQYAIFNIPIRTIQIRDKYCEMGIGSGITIDSSPKKEFEECLLKARFLTDLIKKKNQVNRHKNDFYLIERIRWDKRLNRDDKTGKRGLYLLDLHLKRLWDSASYFDFKIDKEELIAKLLEVTGNICRKEMDMVIRLCLFRDGRFTIQYTEYENMKKNKAFRVVMSEKKTDPDDVFLYHKTSNREFYNSEHIKAMEKGYIDCIFVNSRDEITEGAITNVFIREGDKLITPSIQCGLLNGTLRQHLINRGIVRERVIHLTELFGQPYFYIGNSVRGLIKVKF